MRDAVSAFLRRIRSGLARLAAREGLTQILPWMALLAGVLLGIAASVPAVLLVHTIRYAGSVGPSETVPFAFNGTGYSYVAFSFEATPRCPLRLYVLDAAGADRYRNGSTLPDPSQSLNCDRTQGTFPFDIVLVVFANAFNDTETYAVRADLFVITQPSAIWAIPAYALFIVGAIAIVIRMLTGGIARIAEEVSRREEIDPREFRRSGDPKFRGPR